MAAEHAEDNDDNDNDDDDDDDEYGCRSQSDMASIYSSRSGAKPMLGGAPSRFYGPVVVATLKQLLGLQTEKVRTTVLQQLCKRLHVRYHGHKNKPLERTLQGLVSRALPAALGALGEGPQRSSSVYSCRTTRSQVLPNRSPTAWAGPPLCLGGGAEDDVVVQVND